jgi:hypothetical protein
LQHHHQGVMPVMITEFGVPSSLGSAHAGTLGRSQGNHTELEALQMAMAGISDPSSHQALIPQGLFRATSVMIPGIGLTISTGGRHVRNTGTVRWNNWQSVRYRERVKAGAAAVRAAFSAVSGDVPTELRPDSATGQSGSSQAGTHQQWAAHGRLTRKLIADRRHAWYPGAAGPSGPR